MKRPRTNRKKTAKRERKNISRKLKRNTRCIRLYGGGEKETLLVDPPVTKDAVKEPEAPKPSVNCNLKKYKKEPYCVEKKENADLMVKYEEICKKNPKYVGCPVSKMKECAGNKSDKCEEFREKVHDCTTLPGNMYERCYLVDKIYKDSFIKCNSNLINGTFFPYFCWYSYNKEKWNPLSKVFS
jgi:hypothetical protein